MNRRDFLGLVSSSALLAALPGCAVDPVTGKQSFVLMGEQDEIAIDRQNAPQQFSLDYGASQDAQLNAYISQLGLQVAAVSHRPHMPYSFRAVNAAYINAYAFPGGSIAVTRGILLELENEAELAALLGHEIGHVNARHAAERMAQGTLLQVALAGGTAYLQSGEYSSYAPYLSQFGGLGASAFLAMYSRDNEREADRLGLQYAVAAGHHPQGMVGLMEVLVNKAGHDPNALERMFASHPMSSERLATARQQLGQYQAYHKRSLQRQRYMDTTVRLRAKAPAIRSLQQGEKQMAAKRLAQAEQSFSKALQLAPRDYAALLMMAKCKMALKKEGEAVRLTERAKQLYPAEPQAVQLRGVALLSLRQFDQAQQEFSRFSQLLPANTDVLFLQGMALEGMGKQTAAAQAYRQYLSHVQQGQAAQHAYQRLQQWGQAG